MRGISREKIQNSSRTEYFKQGSREKQKVQEKVEISHDNRDNESSQPQAFGKRLTGLWPAFPCMAFGLWSAWTALAYSGSSWLSLDSEINAINLSVFYVITSLAQVVLLFGGAAFVRLKGHSITVDKTTMACGIIASIGCFGVIIIGPHYLGSMMGVSISNTIFWVLAVFIGLGMAVVSLRCGAAYGMLTPRRTIINVGLSQLVAAFVFFMDFACSQWAFVEGGPSIVSIVFFTLLPIAAAWVACQSPNDQIREVANASESHPSSQPSIDIRISSPFWRLLILSFMIPLVISMMRGAVVNYHALAITTEGSTLLMVLRVALGIVLVAVGLMLDTQSMRFGRIMALIAVFSSSIIAGAAALGGLASGWSILAYFASMVFDLLLWCLLAFIVIQKHIPSDYIFGLGRGAFTLGSGIGWALGTWVTPLVPAGNPTTTMYVGSALIMLVLSIILFSERDYEQLFLPTSDRELPLSDLFDVEQRVRQLEAEEDAHGKKSGVFQRAIARRAKESVLSARETDVFRLLAMGYGSDYVADTLGLSVNTVRVHTHNIYVKLDVHSRAELMELVDRDVALERDREARV